MVGGEPRYEVTEIKAIRGTESRTITSKQQDGWELVTQQEGLLRTTMTFRRPKPKAPWKLWAALGGAGVVLVGVIAVGALREDNNDDSITDAKRASTSTDQPPLQPASELESPSSGGRMICDTTKLVSEPCKFGQTAIYEDTVRSGEVKLEITVGAPVEFVPTEDAWTLYDLPLGPMNVYFPITVTNLSPELVLGQSSISTEVANAEQSGRYDGMEQ